MKYLDLEMDESWKKVKSELKDKINCVNVKFGFEGDLSNENRRGNLNGWKFSDLPWKQQ